MICIDDLNDWTGFLGGHPDVLTPHMDKLAKRGRNFANAHCTVPVCSSSRISVMSGLAATTHGSYEIGLHADNRADHIHWFESKGGRNDTQAFSCRVGNAIYIAFRGTQEFRDFLTDAKTNRIGLQSFDGSSILCGSGSRMDMSRRNYKVHHGFSDALDSIWSDEIKNEAYAKAQCRPTLTLSKYLENLEEQETQDSPQKLKLWLTGHSLGGALATVSAARIQLSDKAPFKGNIGGLITIG